MIPLLFLTRISVVRAETIATTNLQPSTISAQNSAYATAGADVKLKQQIQLLLSQKASASGQIKDYMKAIIQAERNKFKSDLSLIKDQNKKTLVERIDTRISDVNTDLTARYDKSLGQLQTFLDRINQSATPTAKLADVTNAQNMINIAKSAVTTQAAKVYIMTITDDSTLKLNAGIILTQFRQDIGSVHELVLEAKQAVENLSPIKPTIINEATSSAKL